MDCGGVKQNDTITHANDGKKFIIEAEWTTLTDVGPVQFLFVYFLCQTIDAGPLSPRRMICTGSDGVRGTGSFCLNHSGETTQKKRKAFRAKKDVILEQLFTDDARAVELAG